MRKVVILGIVIVVVVLAFTLFGTDDGPGTSQPSANPTAIQQE